MKKTLILMFVLALAWLMPGAQAAAANGARDGDGPLCTVVDTFTDLTGTVEDCLEGGGGLVLLTGEEGDQLEVTVYGIGPSRYWESQGVDRPVVGDTITVSGYIVDCSGVERYILTSVEIPVEDGDPIVVPLRDPETGKPLWRSLGKTGDMPYGPTYGRDGEMGEYGPGYGKNSEDNGNYGTGFGSDEASSSGNGGKGGK